MHTTLQEQEQEPLSSFSATSNCGKEKENKN
jgi:hypothetical protein